MNNGATLALLFLLAVILSAIIFAIVCRREKKRKEENFIATASVVVKEVKHARKEQTTAADLIGGMMLTWQHPEVLGTSESMDLILKTCAYMVHLDLDRQVLGTLLDKSALGEVSLEKMGTSEKEIKELERWVREKIFLENM